ncbi:MAG: MFS transporter [Geminicoccaceae bacterium]|nr:MFS transporter [Geminicoccaceae bacterium]
MTSPSEQRDSGDFRAQPVPVVPLGAVCVLFAMGFGILAPAIPVMMAEFGMTPVSASFFVTGSSAVIAVACLISGSLADRAELRTILSGGLAVFILGSVVAAFAEDYRVLIGGRLVQACGGAVCMTMARLAVRRSFRPKETMRLLSLFAFWMVACGILASVIGGWMTELSSWRMIFVFEISCALICWFFILRGGGLRRCRFGEAGRHGAMPLAARLRSLCILPFALLVILHSASSALILAEIIWIPQIAAERFGMSAGAIGTWRMVLSVAMAAGCIIPARFAALAEPQIFAYAAVSILVIGLPVFLASSHTFDHPAGLFLPAAFVATSCGILLALAPSWCMVIASTAPGTGLGVMAFSVGLLSSGLVQLVTVLSVADVETMLATAMIVSCGIELAVVVALFLWIRSGRAVGPTTDMPSADRWPAPVHAEDPTVGLARDSERGAA